MEPDNYFDMCQDELNAKNYSLALSHIKNHIKLYPTDKGSILLRGICYFELDNYKQAIDDIEFGIAAIEENYHIYPKLSFCYSALGNYEKAIEYDTLYIQYHPEEAKAYSARGSNYNESGKYELALKDYNTSVAKGNKSHRVYFERATVYFNLEKYDKAFSDLKIAIKLSPDDIYTLKLLYKYNYINEKYNECINILSHILYLDPDFPEALMNRMLCKKAIGDRIGQQNDVDLMMRTPDKYFQLQDKDGKKLTAVVATVEADGNIEMRVK